MEQINLRGRGQQRKERRATGKERGGDSEDEKRKSRAREAQKNFQLRRQAKASDLEKRISTLEDTIEQMSTEFLDFGDRVANKAQIASQPLILDEVKTSTQRFLHLAREIDMEDEFSGSTSQSQGGSENENLKRVRIELPKPDFHPMVLSTTSPFEFPALMLSATPQLPSQAIRQITPDGRTHMLSQSSGRFSPRLDYGLRSPSVPLTYFTPNPESPFMTYVISGPGSFALRLYVDTASLIFNILRGYTSMPGYIPMVCRYRFRYEQPRSLMEKLRFQLDKMHIDATDPEPAIQSQIPASNSNFSDEAGEELVLFGPTDYVFLDALMLKIVRDYTQEAGSLGDWLDPWSTQQYLTHHWGFQLSSTTAKITSKTLSSLETPLNPTPNPSPSYENPLVPENWWLNPAVPNLNPSPQFSSYDKPRGPPVFGQGIFPTDGIGVGEELGIDARQLARKIGFHAMCFGEGPRFNRIGIDQVVREILGEMSLGGGVGWA